MLRVRERVEDGEVDDRRRDQIDRGGGDDPCLAPCCCDLGKD